MDRQIRSATGRRMTPTSPRGLMSPIPLTSMEPDLSKPGSRRLEWRSRCYVRCWRWNRTLESIRTAETAGIIGRLVIPARLAK